MAVKYSNGNIQCHLTRPRSMLVYSEHEGNITFDLNNRYYLFLAWGAVYTNTDVLVHHYELPAVTESTVNFYDNQIVRGTTLHVLVQVHGILMFVAWILFVGITTIVSRYYKEGFGRKLMCGMKPWFQLHRSCGIVAWLLTAAAFVVIFIKVQGLSQIAKVHSYLGIAVMSACTLQVLAGLFRPGLDSNIRSAFNFVHWLFGKTTHILSVVTFYFAFTSDVISSQQLDFGVVVLSVWVGNQVFWEIVFEVRKCTRSKGVSEKYELSNVKTSGGLEMESRDDTYQTMSRIDAVFLCMYVICILTLTAGAIASVILY